MKCLGYIQHFVTESVLKLEVLSKKMMTMIIMMVMMMTMMIGNIQLQAISVIQSCDHL